MSNYGFNPYGQQQYGGGYNSQYQQYQSYPNYTQPQPMAVYPLTYTNGLIGAKAFPLQQPNSTVYLIDSDTNDIIYKKDADNQGRCTLKAFKTIEIPLEQVGTPMQNNQMNFATKQDIEIIQKSLNDIMATLKGVPNEQQSNANVNANTSNG